MMSCTAGYIHFGIAVVHHVKTPHEADFVQQEVNKILSDQIKSHQGKDEFHPKWNLRQKEQTKFIFLSPAEYTHRKNSEKNIDNESCTEKNQVNLGVSPLFVTVSHQWVNALCNPTNTDATDYPGKLLPSRHGFKKQEHLFHLQKLFGYQNNDFESF